MVVRMQRKYTVTAADPVALARELGVPFSEVSLRLGVTQAWARQMAATYRHASRVRVAVLETALERARLERLLT
jgi:hypothetical protein